MITLYVFTIFGATAKTANIMSNSDNTINQIRGRIKKNTKAKKTMKRIKPNRVNKNLATGFLTS